MLLNKLFNINKEEYPWYKYYDNMKCHLDYPKCSMYELIRKNAKSHMNNIAYSYYGTKVTYRRFLNKIDQVASSYSYLGVRKGTNVAIIMPNTPEAIISFYALNKLGAVISMLHPLSSEEEIKYNIKLTNPEFVLMCDIVFDKINNIQEFLDVKKYIYVSVSQQMNFFIKLGFLMTKAKSISKPYGDKFLSWTYFLSNGVLNKTKTKDCGSYEDVAVILYSGGTTGKSKGIELTNMNMNALCLQGSEIAQVITPGIKVLGIMPIFHGFGLGVTFHVTFNRGAEAIILPTVNPKEFDKTLLKLKPNVIACVPSLLETLPYSSKLKKTNLSFIKGVFCGGDYLNIELNKKLDEFLYEHNCDARVRTAYGMTECSAGAAMMPIKESRLGSIGVPIPDTVIKIVDPKTNKECKTGEIGELIINSLTVMRGYINDPEETKNVLKEHDGKIWLHTGDLGYIDEDGFVYFTSRLKRMIVSSGYNVYPGQIEEIINSHPYVKTSVVVGIPHPYKVQVCKAYIVLKDGIELNSDVKQSIKEHCKKSIAAYALPYAYGYRKELPKTKLGKVAYRELEKEGNNEDEK